MEELAGLGAAVHTCSRTGTDVRERVKEWESKGYKVTGSVCDLTSCARREELIKTVSSTFDGKLNILVSSQNFSFLVQKCLRWRRLFCFTGKLLFLTLD